VQKLRENTKSYLFLDKNGDAKPTNKTELGLLEEDDEFEEFETEDWQQDDKATHGEKDVNLWEDNWDDDNIEDDFTIQLRFKK
jgi:26 proteasome complex subunit DSS1